MPRSRSSGRRGQGAAFDLIMDGDHVGGGPARVVPSALGNPTTTLPIATRMRVTSANGSTVPISAADIARCHMWHSRFMLMRTSRHAGARRNCDSSPDAAERKRVEDHSSRARGVSSPSARFLHRPLTDCNAPRERRMRPGRRAKRVKGEGSLSPKSLLHFQLNRINNRNI